MDLGFLMFTCVYNFGRDRVPHLVSGLTSHVATACLEVAYTLKRKAGPSFRELPIYSSLGTLTPVFPATGHA